MWGSFKSMMSHAMTKKHSMFHDAGKSKFVIPSLLLISLIANILALTLPFLEIDEAFHKTVVYSLPHSVNLMWQHKLYVVSLLILCFSIIFPFVKLISLFLVWFVPWDAKRRELHGWFLRSGPSRCRFLVLGAQVPGTEDQVGRTG